MQNHSYMLEGVHYVDGTEYVDLGNPWGYNQPLTVSLSEIASGFDQVEIGHTGAPEIILPPPVANGGLVLFVSENAWMGDAQFTVSIDGVQREGTYTATSPHGTSSTGGQGPQQINLGLLSPGQHQVGIGFINDAYGGSSTTDRNLYIDSVTYNGSVVAGGTGALFSNGMFDVGVQVNSLPQPRSQGLVVSIQEDAWQGDAQFTISIDGKQLGDIYTATASHTISPSSSSSQQFAFQVAPGTGVHRVDVTFINDAYGGTSTTDRNLYVTGATFDGAVIPDAATSLFSNGTANFSFDSSVSSRSMSLNEMGLTPADLIPPGVSAHPFSAAGSDALIGAAVISSADLWLAGPFQPVSTNVTTSSGIFA